MTSNTSTGLAVIQRVSTLKGIIQAKKKTTTVTSIVTTCFLERSIDALSVAAAATTYKIKRTLQFNEFYHLINQSARDFLIAAHYQLRAIIQKTCQITEYIALSPLAFLSGQWTPRTLRSNSSYHL